MNSLIYIRWLDRLGGLDILPEEYNDGYIWADENSVHTLSYYLTGKILNYNYYSNNTGSAAKKIGNRYRFWSPNGRGKGTSVSILNISGSDNHYIINYAFNHWEGVGGDDLSIDYNKRTYGTIEVRRSGNVNYPFTFVSSK